ncbi:MAG: TMEM165/GDT1 family protein [Nitrososphaerota archaeon]|nr:TMEM165/GDT1 family protein [Nitrososphaerota archaeon]
MKSWVSPFESALILATFATIVLTIFVVELTDKDALLLLTLATRIRPRTAFLSGAIAFTITSAVIVTLGYFLIKVVPIYWVRVAGGFVMIGFGLFEYLRKDGEKERVLKTAQGSEWAVFLGAVSMLVLLDLAGDATEVMTIVFVARFSNALLVFFGAVLALVVASGIETFLGKNLGNVLSARRVRIMSLIVFVIIGIVIIATTVLGVPSFL